MQIVIVEINNWCKIEAGLKEEEYYLEQDFLNTQEKRENDSLMNDLLINGWLEYTRKKDNS